MPDVSAVPLQSLALRCASSWAGRPAPVMTGGGEGAGRGDVRGLPDVGRPPGPAQAEGDQQKHGQDPQPLPALRMRVQPRVSRRRSPGGAGVSRAGSRRRRRLAAPAPRRLSPLSFMFYVPEFRRPAPRTSRRRSGGRGGEVRAAAPRSVVRSAAPHSAVRAAAPRLAVSGIVGGR